ncbi:hypothetical protein MSAN_02418700 [Mycena sanguinolenta]|uniref:Adenylate kinase n=1 Tax=Mycena sanguinolenta TaxID=230812 RepID=A0A8H7CF20_9AGAR|nr:hypothetical protein MSAN_02418700 [Mycena sanguinolenta]
MIHPPLLGDGRGNYRVHIVGNCGKLTSTVGKQLADLLGLPLISLDALFWKPGWEKSTNEEMRARVEQRLSECPNGWVVDGNYTRRIGMIVENTSTDVIWLDPPLALYLPRIIWRTFLRMLRLEEPCSPGCPESIREVFSPMKALCGGASRTTVLSARARPPRWLGSDLGLTAILRGKNAQARWMGSGAARMV